MMREYYEEPDFKVVMFETEEPLMTISGQPETDDEGWITIIVKP